MAGNYYTEPARNAVPPYLQGLIGEPSSTGKSETKTERFGFQRPQDMPTLRAIYEQSVGGTAPELTMAGVGEGEVNRLFTEAIRANQEMARKGVAARRGARGMAPLSTGVSQQQEASAMMPLRQRIAEFSLADAFAVADAKRKMQERRDTERQRGLEALFGAASGPVSEDRTTTTTRQEQLATRPLPDTMPEVRYPTQSMSAAGGSIGGGGGGGGLSGDSFWDKPFDPFGGWKDIGGRRAAIDAEADRYMQERGFGGRNIPGEGEWRPLSPDEPPGGGPTPVPGLGGPGIWGEDAPGAFPAQPSGDDEWEQVQGGSGAGAFMARRRRGETGAYSRF